jgi:type IV pilus assembly protein PilA
MLAIVNTRWLVLMRSAVVLTLVAMLAPYFAFSVNEFSVRHVTEDTFTVILLSFFWFPYAIVLWGSRRVNRLDPKSVKKALALAITWGTFLFLLSSLLFFEGLSRCYRDWPAIGMGIIIALIQIISIFGAIRCYYSMERAPGDRRVLINSTWITMVAMLALAVLVPHVTVSRLAANEASAVGSIRTIISAQSERAKDRNKAGFATSLSQLGAGSDSEPSQTLLDNRLASGKKSGYTFTLTAGQPENTGQTNKYTISARPERYGSCGIRSFFSDETGVIRHTASDRAATVSDPPLN